MNKEDQEKDKPGSEFGVSTEMSKIDKSVLKSVARSAFAGAVIVVAMAEKAVQGGIGLALFNEYVKRRSKEIGPVALADEILQSYQKKDKSEKKPGMKP